ncbi:MAG: hypothetical protein NVV74_18045 [Magnetospirillum sp.]|nr:hypothetical protein [Magnetospirillum sp.]
MLLSSWATPPARRPSASSFWPSVSASSSWRRSSAERTTSVTSSMPISSDGAWSVLAAENDVPAMRQWRIWPSGSGTWWSKAKVVPGGSG